MTYPCRTCQAPHGSPKARASHERMHSGPSLEQRFWSKVDMSGGLFECRPWTGARVRGSYGRIAVGGRSVKAHRLALSMSLGRPLGDGMHACHSCDNPPCCNPAHLFEAPGVDNIADRHLKRRDAIGSRNGRARLTEDRVRVIRRMRSEGMCPTAISQALAVPVPTVKNVTSRRSWRHVA